LFKKPIKKGRRQWAEGGGHGGHGQRAMGGGRRAPHKMPKIQNYFVEFYSLKNILN